MSLIDNVKECFESGQIPKEPSFRAVLFGESALYLENVKSIVCFDNEQIILALKTGGLRVFGNCITVKKYCSGDLVVCGKIKGLEKI